MKLTFGLDGVVARVSRRLALRMLAVMLLACPLALQAQMWDAERLLTQTRSDVINLVVTKDGQSQAVDTVRRSWVERTQIVTARIAAAMSLGVPTTYVTKGASPNAFVTMDKNNAPIMAINTEMLRMVGDSDEELAAVIGHELGHLKANHPVDGRQRANVVNLLGLLLGVAVDVNQARKGNDTGGLGMQLGALGGGLVNAKFSRDQEREADQIGVEAMARAGYAPVAASNLWLRMLARGSGSSGWWLSTHPSPEERQQTLQSAAAQLTVDPASTSAIARVGLPTVNDPYPLAKVQTLQLTAEELSADPPSLYRQAVQAYQAREFEKAADLLNESVQSENTGGRAQVRLGVAALRGEGATKDEVRGAQMIRAGVEAGLTEAMPMLADLVRRGVGQRADVDESYRLNLIAFHRGSGQGAAGLANHYLSGQGVARDTVKARVLAEEAARRNSGLGKALAGMMMREEVGGPREHSRSFDLLRESVVQIPNSAFAQFHLARSYETGSGVARNTDLAVQGYRKALVGGFAAARERLRELGFAE